MTERSGIILGVWLVTWVAFSPGGHAQTETGSDEESVTDTRPKRLTPGLAQAPKADPLAGTEQPAPEPAIAPTPDEPARAEEIVITGTRIKRKSIATPAPVSVVNKEDLLASGKTTVAEILQRLPVNQNGQNIQSIRGDGSSRINLRSLGANRTLVLINGRRHVPGGNGANSSVDLNSIPVSIVERVEVLKDGASAIYGSDAVAGVVNIITRSDFDGVEANAYTSISQEGDGRTLQVDLTAGASSDDGNITFSVMFLDSQPIFSQDRPFAANARDFDWAGFVAAGSPRDDRRFIFNSGNDATPQGMLRDDTGAPGNAAWDATGCAKSLCYNDPIKGWRKYEIPQDHYNFQPETYTVTPSRRISLFSQGHYEISKLLGVFFEAGFTNRVSEQLTAPTPLSPRIAPNAKISAKNRYNTFEREFTYFRRRMVEAGNRLKEQDSNTFRVVVGAEGELPAWGPFYGWAWDLYGNFGRTETINTEHGRFNARRLELAIGPASGCKGDCVALDLFGGAGTITPEMIDYLSYTGIDRGFTEQNIIAANVGGPLYELVEGNPIAVAFGYEFRRESGADVPNPLRVSGEATGSQRRITEGSFEVHAGYGEVSLPLLAHVPGVEMLELSAAGRLVEFDSFGSNLSGKLGIRWQPVEFAALRATYSTAFRAPSILELFSGEYDTSESAQDPCSSIPGTGSLNIPIVAANCAQQGYPNGVPDPSEQLRTRKGGNPELKPETARIWTLGAVLEDSLINGLTIAIDYYNIDIDNAIENIGTVNILSSCLKSENKQSCNLIKRDSVGIIQYIIDIQNNVGGFKAQGVDFDVRYSTPSPLGRFGAGVEATVLLELVQVQFNGFEQSYKGNFDQNRSNVDYRINGYLRWAKDWVNAGVNLRYLPSFTECKGSCNADRAPSTSAPPAREVDAWFYMDLFAGVNLDTHAGRTSLTLGINNLTNVEPPFIRSAQQPRFDPRNYDFIGRQFYARLTQTF